MDVPVLDWLMTSAVGPALFSWPVALGEQAAAAAARTWWRRWRRKDDLGTRSADVLAAVIGLPLSEADVQRLEDLLCSPELWATAAQSNGTVEDSLILPIRDCLGRTATEPTATAGARAIAASVLAESLRGSDPDRFDLVLAGVLKSEASVLASMTAVVVTLDDQLSAQSRVDATRFRAIISHLDRAMVRLPPGPAGRIEVRSYLEAMVRVLDRSPWMAELFDRWAGVSATAQPLLVRARAGKGDERLTDPVEVARASQRLVITGPPGAGKTWLARRIAMDAAHKALARLDRGEPTASVPIPLFVELSHWLLAGASATSARGELIAASLRLVTDLLPGGDHTAEALRRRFLDTRTSVVLVLDGLDESPRDIRADLLSFCEGGVKVVLTTRESAWAGQVPLDRNDDGHVLARLAPLDLDSGVPHVVYQLLGPEAGRRLLTLLGDSEQLSSLARSPLLCVWLCAIAARLDEGDELPANEIELCRALISAVASGRWRRGGPPAPSADTAAVRRALQDLAWAAATDDPHTGLAAWGSDAPSMELGAISADQRELLSAVAPVSRISRPWESEVRTFIHERLREHLVAEHLAAEPVDQAYRHLESHIWYDPKWEYILPAAIYLHPQQDQLLAMILDRGGIRAGAAAPYPEGDGVLEVRSLLRRLLDLGNGTAPTDPVHRAVVERIALSTSTRKVVAWSKATWEDYTWDAAALDRQLNAALEHQPIPGRGRGLVSYGTIPHPRSEPPETLMEIEWRLTAERLARADADPDDDAILDDLDEAPREAFEQIVAFTGGDAPDKEVLWERSLELIEHHRGEIDSWLGDPGHVPELLSLLRSTGCPTTKVRSALVAFGDILMGSQYFASENEGHPPRKPRNPVAARRRGGDSPGVTDA